MRIAVVALKGGVGKTTTAMFVAAGLARQAATALVDANCQQSAYRWAGRADSLPFPVIPWPDGRQLARQVRQLAGRFDHVVLDTPPERAELARAALAAADLAVVPTGPNPMDAEQIRDVFVLATAVMDERGTDFPVVALLTRVDNRTADAAQIRSFLITNQVPRLAAEVRELRVYAWAYGSSPVALYEYEDVLAELTRIGQE